MRNPSEIMAAAHKMNKSFPDESLKTRAKMLSAFDSNRHWLDTYGDVLKDAEKISQEETEEEFGPYTIYSSKGNLVGSTMLATAKNIHGDNIDKIDHASEEITLKPVSPYGKEDSYSWDQINTALMAETYSPKRILSILMRLTKGI